MNNNEILEYKNLLYKVKGMVEKISSVGFNVDKYNSILNNIVHNYEIGFYTLTLIEELDKLEEELLKYDIYFKAVNTISYINSQLNKINYKKDTVNKQSVSSSPLLQQQINDMVSKVIVLLDEIRGIDVSNSENETKILSEVYSLIYELIKYELIHLGNSNLFENIKKHDADLYFVNKCIKKEIQELDLDDTKKLNDKIKELNINGISENNYDLETIKLLLVCNGLLNVNNNVSNELSNVINQINISNVDIIEKKGEIEREKRKLKMIIKDFRDEIANFIPAAITVLTTTSVMIGGIFGIYTGLKKVNTKDHCKLVTSTYSNWEGLNMSDKWIRLDRSSFYEEKIYLKEYGVWEDASSESFYKYQREVKIYDVSNYHFDNLEDYVNYGIDNYGVNFETETEYGNDVQLYSNSYIGVEKSDVDTSVVEKQLIRNNFGIAAFSSYLGYILFWVIFFMINGFNCSFIWESYYIIIDCINYVISKKRDVKEQLKILENKMREAINLINSNDELKLEFNRLYNENKYLLDNPEELLVKFSEVSSKIEQISLNELKKVNVKRLTKGK